MLRRYHIVVDGTVVTRLKEGDSFLFETGPGDHELYAKIDWAKTKPRIVTLASGEVARFAVRPGGATLAGLGQAAISPQNYLVIERL